MGKIRFLLALSVVAVHCGPIGKFYMLGGEAVQAFFIISGFYMSLVLNQKYIGVNNSYRLFITNRYLRLAPTYWVVLLLTVLLSLTVFIAYKNSVFSFFGMYASVHFNILSLGYLIFTNLFILGQDLVVLLGIDPANGHLYFTSDFLRSTPPLFLFLFVPQAWTLGLELTFYLLAPFILKKGFATVLLFMVLSLSIRLIFYYYLHLRNDPWTYRFFPEELLFFLLGYFSYRIYIAIKNITIPKFLSQAFVAFVVLITICYSFLPTTSVSVMGFSFRIMAYYGLLIIGIPFIFNYLKNDKLDNAIGELSYPIYISHMLIKFFCSIKAFEALNSAWIITILTILFSYILVKFIINPLEKYRQMRLITIDAGKVQ
jgi:peptidoglycan/LPS O-acetylase OafA/YrhL